MSDIKIKMIENNFYEATKELHPKKEKPDQNLAKNKRRKHQQQTWGDRFLISLGWRDLFY